MCDIWSKSDQINIKLHFGVKLSPTQSRQQISGELDVLHTSDINNGAVKA